MRIEIVTRGFDLTEGLREHTERRLKFALSWAGAEVRAVRVSLFDVNGPRGGCDKCCRIQIPMARAASVVIEDAEPDLYVAIDRAADRTGRTMARRLERLHGYRQPRPTHEQPMADVAAETLEAFS